MISQHKKKQFYAFLDTLPLYLLEYDIPKGFEQHYEAYFKKWCEKIQDKVNIAYEIRNSKIEIFSPDNINMRTIEEKVTNIHNSIIKKIHAK